MSTRSARPPRRRRAHAAAAWRSAASKCFSPSLDLKATVARHHDKLLKRLIGEDIQLTSVLAPDLGVVKADPGRSSRSS